MNYWYVWKVYINTLVSISYLIMKTMYDYYEDKEHINISLRVAQNSKIYYRKVELGEILSNRAEK
jgi:hypothetical protein